MAARGRARGATESPCGSGSVALEPRGAYALVAAISETNRVATEKQSAGLCTTVRVKGEGGLREHALDSGT